MNQLRIVRQVALVVAVLFASAGAIRAQPVSINASSVEWVAANSCLVVHAVIEEVSVHKLKGGPHPRDVRHRYQTVTVRVIETLKGEHSERLQFVDSGDWGRDSLSNLKESKQQILLFLEPWSNKFHRRSPGGYVYARFPLVVKDAVIFTTEDSRWVSSSVLVLSSNLTRLSTPTESINAIKSYLKNRVAQESLQAATISLSSELRGGAYRVEFTVPVDADIKNRASFDIPRSRPILGFDDFKRKFGKTPPAKRRLPYLREAGGYVGVYALNLMAADCEVIVRAVVEESCFARRIDDPTGDQFGVKFGVVENIKGETPGQITCFVTDARGLEQLRRDKQELILFLRSNHESVVSYPEGALQFRTRDRLWDDSVIVLNKASAEVLFADLTWHRGPEEILARLRAVVKSNGKNEEAKESPSMCVATEPRVFEFHPPASIAAGSSIAGNQYSIIYLPVNRELEDSARKWASEGSEDRRWLAARAMVYFKSDKNAAVLKRMLDDDAAWTRREMLQMTGLSYPHEPEFLVRWEAWHVLAGWGYDVLTPIFTRSR